MLEKKQTSFQYVEALRHIESIAIWQLPIPKARITKQGLSRKAKTQTAIQFTTTFSYIIVKQQQFLIRYVLFVNEIDAKFTSHLQNIF